MSGMAARVGPYARMPASQKALRPSPRPTPQCSLRAGYFPASLCGHVARAGAARHAPGGGRQRARGREGEGTSPHRGRCIVLTPEKIYTLVFELTNPDKRETALLELSKKREAIPGTLWRA